MKFFALTVMLCALAIPAMAKPLRVVALGDSLISGYGLAKGDDYATQLQTALRADKLDVVVENAGISGDTSEAGLARLDDAIKGDKPDLVIVALGGNDILRSIDPAVTRQNLQSILQRLKDLDIPAVLYGMRVPPFQYPEAYRRAINDLYEDLSDDYDVELYPFFLEGVWMNSSLKLGDGIHPNKQGVALMVSRTQELVMDEID